MPLAPPFASGHPEYTMPIYEYACGDCGREFEALVRSGTQLECPSCHSHLLEKKLSAATVAGGGGHSHPGPCGSCGHPNGPGSCGLS